MDEHTALMEEGEFLDEVEELEGEHRQFDAVLAALDVDAADFADVVTHLLDPSTSAAL